MGAGGRFFAVVAALLATVAATAPVTAAAGAVVPARAGTTTLTWTPSVAPLGSLGTDPVENVASVSCPASGGCVAVGTYAEASDLTRPLLLLQHPSGWTATRAPVPAGADGAFGESLLRVACGAPGDCAAIGSVTGSAGETTSYLLVESGGGWQAVTPPLPADAASTGQSVRLEGVSCEGAECTAVGTYVTTTTRAAGLIVQGAGGSWTATAVPAPAGTGPVLDLSAVSCTAPATCAVVGDFSLNGSDQTEGLAVDETSAAGWQAPTALVVDSSFSDLRMSAISCPVAGWCLATGYDSGAGGFFFVDDAGTWTSVASPLPPGTGPQDAADLLAVSCGGSGQCEAGGYLSGGSADDSPIVVSYAGGTVAASVAPVPAGGAASGATDQIASIACFADLSCTALGLYPDQQSVAHDDVLTLRGGAWTAAALALPAGGTAIASTGLPLGCEAAASCVAGGSYEDRVGAQQGLLDQDSGSGWIAARAPVPAGGGVPWRAALGAVTCSPGPTCVAVGTAVDVGPPYGPVAQPDAVVERRSSAGVWTPALVPLPAAVRSMAGTTFSGIACSTAEDCVAIGASYVGNQLYDPLVLAEHAGAWSASVLPLPGAFTSQPSPELSSVACLAGGRCVITGSYYTSPTSTTALVVVGSAGAWTDDPLALPPNAAAGGASAFLRGVSCATSFCVASGQYDDDAGGVGGFLDTFAGGKWSSVEAPDGAGAKSPRQQGVSPPSCTPAGRCVVPSGYETTAGHFVPVFEISAAAGSGWSALPLPSPPGTTAIPDVGPVACDAVRCAGPGSYASKRDMTTLVGNRVSYAHITHPAGEPVVFSYLYSTTCDGTGTCVATGELTITPSQYYEGWIVSGVHGSPWSSVMAPVPSDASAPDPDVHLAGAACVAGGPCVAVGTYASGPVGLTQGLIETSR